MAMETLLLLLLLPSLLPSNAEEIFDVRKHLSTVTRYDFAKDATIDNYVASTIPDGCTAIHVNLVARHGTRAPTKKRIRELDNLTSRLEALLNNAQVEAQKGNASLQKIPSWLWGWESPWKGRKRGGELTGIGENELYHLAARIREKFPDLFDEEYHHDTFVIKATQSDNEKIRELSQQILLEKRRSATYKKYLELLFKHIDEHTESLSKKIQYVVDAVKDVESEGVQKTR